MAKPIATAVVPFITDLAQGSDVLSENSRAAQEPPSAREGWKTYLRHVLPHAEKHIRCFMLACLADGHSFQDDEEGRANMATKA